MKFEETLASSLAPEWKTQYLVYKQLKKVIYQHSSVLSSTESTLYADVLKESESEFYEIVYNEMEKINNFYNEKLAEATRKYAELTRELRVLKHVGTEVATKTTPQRTLRTTISQMDYDSDTPIELNISPLKFNYKKRMKSLSYIYTEFYLSVVILVNYQHLNYTGFRKILKKHDKNWNVTSGNEFFIREINRAQFHVDDNAQKILLGIEETYIKEFARGDRSRGMSELRVPPLDELDSKVSFPSFIMGASIAAIILLLAVIIAKYKYRPPEELERISIMFRGQLVISMFIVLVSVNVYIWRHCGVNHVLIFEIDPRHHIGFAETIAVGLVYVAIVFICMCGYMFHKEMKIEPKIFPLVSLLTIIGLTLNPLNIFYRSSRYFFLKALLRNIIAGFVYVRFVDFWLGDQMTSLVGPLKDLNYMACSFLFESSKVVNCDSSKLSTIYVVGAAPYYLRALQCIRRYWNTRENIHLYNMAKYLSCVIVEVFVAVYTVFVDNRKHLYMIIVPRLISTTYLTTWDLCVDWSLVVYSDSKKQIQWRRKRIYKRNAVYVMALILDVVIRYGWIFYYIPESYSTVSKFVVITVFQMVDAIRRFVWNFFRVENEHINNIGKYRTVRDISIKPLAKQNLQSVDS